MPSKSRNNCRDCAKVKTLIPIGGAGSIDLPGIVVFNSCCNKVFLVDCTKLVLDPNNFSTILLDTKPNTVCCCPGKPISFIFKLAIGQRLRVTFSTNLNNIANVISSPVGVGINTNPCLTLISDCLQYSILNTYIGWTYDNRQ